MSRDKGSRAIKVKAAPEGGVELELSQETANGLIAPLREAWLFVQDWMQDRRALASAERRLRYRTRFLETCLKVQDRINATGNQKMMPLSDKILEIAGPAIAVEDDENVQDVWAAILAEAMNPDKQDRMEGVVHVMKDLPSEAVIALRELSLPVSKEKGRISKSIYHHVSEGRYIGYEHLIRTGLIREQNFFPDGSVKRLVEAVREEQEFLSATETADAIEQAFEFQDNNLSVHFTALGEIFRNIIRESEADASTVVPSEASCSPTPTDS